MILHLSGTARASGREDDDDLYPRTEPRRERSLQRLRGMRQGARTQAVLEDGRLPVVG
jgi:hypothetical protein